MLKAETIANVNPIGKDKIYFAARREDYGYLNSIISLMFQVANVAVYHDDEQNCANTTEEELSSMNMILLLLTEGLLSDPCDALTRVLPFAIRHHIPLMIVGTDPEIGPVFNRFCEEHGLGNRHVLFAPEKDPEGIFRGKLKDFLNEYALAHEDHEQILQYLDGRIFLSYRKLDKPLASRVIAQINRAPECLRYGLWYDEYLTSGEDYNDEIRHYIDVADIFLFLVTPRMLQPDSYAIREELTHALQAGKKVVILDMLEEDQEIPPAFLQGDCLVVTEDSLQELPAVLGSLLEPYGEKTPQMFPDQCYYLGLAYLRGIAKNKDERIAIELIRSAADTGEPKAMDTMVKLSVDHEEMVAAIQWQKLLTQHYKQVFEKERGLSSLDEYLRHLGILAEYYRMAEQFEEIYGCYQQIYDCLSDLSGWENDPGLLESAIIAVDNLGTFAELSIEHAEDKQLCFERARRYYSLCYEYGEKYARLEKSLKTERFLYTALIRLAELDQRWTDVPEEEIFHRYERILQLMLKADQAYSCDDTLSDLSGCYRNLTGLSAKVCPQQNYAFALKWLEYARASYLNTRYLTCCEKYAEAMEYVAKLQAGKEEVAEAIQNLNKASKARMLLTESYTKQGTDADRHILALFYDLTNVAYMQCRNHNLTEAQTALLSAQNTLQNYSKVLWNDHNLEILQELRSMLE
ncbi:MAG: toll/interleukin-1 receptor domain-containing protein [Lachnospiraceae bacterium]|nr:toll/interleukin-1 receptor domain-containing protein [Lachnospiraceae bacterium]